MGLLIWWITEAADAFQKFKSLYVSYVESLYSADVFRLYAELKDWLLLSS